MLPNSREREQGFSTAVEAIEDFVRDFAIQTSRAEAIRSMKEMRPDIVAHAIQGRVVERPPSGFEMMMATVVENCTRSGLLQGPVDSIGALSFVRVNLLHDRGIFVGQDKPPGQE